jgi:predicted dehydrogenase
VGLGWVATHRHLPWLSRDPQVRVVGLVDHHPDRLHQARTRFRVELAAVAEDARGVPWLDRVDAVCIGTPPATHHRVATSYLEAGKHVLLEKPMAMTVEEARDLQALAERRGRILAVVHNFQFARSVVRLRRLVAAGRLGRLTGIWGVQLSNPRRRLPAWYEELPLGLFYDESPHLLYLARAVAGAEPRLGWARVTPSASGRETPSRVTAAFEAGGLPVHLEMAFEAPLSEWQLLVLGSERMAAVDVFRDVLVVLRNDGAHQARDILATSLDGVRGHLWGSFTSGLRLAAGRLAYGNDLVAARFARACLTGQPPAGISAADGVRVVEMQHEVMRAGSALPVA